MTLSQVLPTWPLLHPPHQQSLPLLSSLRASYRMRYDHGTTSHHLGHILWVGVKAGIPPNLEGRGSQGRKPLGLPQTLHTTPFGAPFLVAHSERSPASHVCRTPSVFPLHASFAPPIDQVAFTCSFILSIRLSSSDSKPHTGRGMPARSVFCLQHL